MGVNIPQAEAVETARQHYFPSGPVGGLLQTALMPAACVEGL